MTTKSFIIIAILLFFVLFSNSVIAGYVPHPKDHFSFYEVENLGNGTGNYIGYSAQTILNGTETINGVNGNGIVSANYSFLWTWSNSTGAVKTGNVSGNFTFSSITFLYVNGTDDQTGYVNPTVWFCMNNSILAGNTFYLLNTKMTVISKNYSYYLSSQKRNVYTIFAQGNSSYQRNDMYGQFMAKYTWNAYFDPSSGCIVGYDYTEQDTNASTGTGFTYTDNLYITSSSYSLTTVPTTSTNEFSDVAFIVLIVIILTVIVIIVYAVSIRRLPKRLPQQSNTLSEMPSSGDTTPNGPAIKCPQCGAPIYFGDKNITNCSYCGVEVEKPSS
jgi:hypothetical protein